MLFDRFNSYSIYCMKNDAFVVFHTRSSCLKNDNISYFIEH